MTLDDEKVIDMHPGLPSTEALPLRAWRAAWRQASYEAPPVSGPPLLGLPALRSAIAAHLQYTRGLVAPDHHVRGDERLADGLRLVLDAWKWSGTTWSERMPTGSRGW